MIFGETSGSQFAVHRSQLARWLDCNRPRTRRRPRPRKGRVGHLVDRSMHQRSGVIDARGGAARLARRPSVAAER
jgi:hypothetical protein